MFCTLIYTGNFDRGQTKTLKTKHSLSCLSTGLHPSSSTVDPLMTGKRLLLGKAVVRKDQESVKVDKSEVTLVNIISN